MAKNPRVILIGGIPTAGKSTLARKLSTSLKMDYLSTDIVSRIIFSVTSKEQTPDMHFFKCQNPNEYYTKHTPNQVVKAMVKDSKEIFKGIMGLVEKNKAINERGIIIEGYALLPELVGLFSRKKYVESLFLTVTKQNQIEENILKRGLWATSKHAKVHEIRCIAALNEYIVKSAQKRGMRIVSAYPRNSLYKRVRKML